jgi:hypothetical protein
LLSFGRRVLFDRQVPNKEVLENHINTLHERATEKKREHETTRL